VDAAMSTVETNAAFPGSIGQMVEAVVPAVLTAKSGMKTGYRPEELLDASVRKNVLRVVCRLRASEPILLDPMNAGKLKIVGARYDLDDGKVDFFPD
jgi:carbonic anhydrase